MSKRNNYEAFATILANAIPLKYGVNKETNEPIECAPPGNCPRCMFDGTNCMKAMWAWLWEEHGED